MKRDDEIVREKLVELAEQEVDVSEAREAFERVFRRACGQLSEAELTPLDGAGLVAADQQNDIVWIPSVPLPLSDWRTDTCECGERFHGKNRRERYEIHYRRAHERDDDTSADEVMMGVTRDECRRIYDLVNADRPDVPPEREQGAS